MHTGGTEGALAEGVDRVAANKSYLFLTPINFYN